MLAYAHFIETLQVRTMSFNLLLICSAFPLVYVCMYIYLYYLLLTMLAIDE